MRNQILILGFKGLTHNYVPGDFAEKHVLKLVEQFSGLCHATKS